MYRDGRLAVRLRSKSRFRDLIELRQTTVLDLADDARVADSLIWHLLRDPKYRTARDTCTATTAVAIEKALKVEPGYLFEPESSPVTHYEPQPAPARRRNSDRRRRTTARAGR